MWSANASVGNIIGALMVANTLHWGYQFSFLVTSSVLFGAGIILFFGIIPSPKEIGIYFPFPLPLLGYLFNKS